MGSHANEYDEKLSSPDVITSIHPNYRKFPVGTRISFTIRDESVERVGEILAWDTSKSVPTDLKLAHGLVTDKVGDMCDGWFPASQISVTSYRLPGAGKEVNVGESNINQETRKPEMVNQKDHPAGTRMYVAYWWGGGYSPDRDVTVTEWSDDGTQVKLQVNVEAGVHTWHVAKYVLFLGLVPPEKSSEPVQINYEQHPVGSRLRIRINYEGIMVEDEISVEDWFYTKTDNELKWDRVLIGKTINYRGTVIPPEVLKMLLPVNVITVLETIDSEELTKMEEMFERDSEEYKGISKPSGNDFLHHCRELKRIGEELGFTVSINLT